MGMVIPGVRYPSESLPLVMLAPIVDEPLAPWTMTGKVLVPETRGETEGPRQPSTPEAGQCLGERVGRAAVCAGAVGRPPAQLAARRWRQDGGPPRGLLAQRWRAECPVGPIGPEVSRSPWRRCWLPTASRRWRPGRYPAVLLVEDTTELTTRPMPVGAGADRGRKGRGRCASNVASSGSPGVAWPSAVVKRSQPEAGPALEAIGGSPGRSGRAS
jgi:hypothetical protein